MRRPNLRGFCLLERFELFRYTPRRQCRMLLTVHKAGMKIPAIRHIWRSRAGLLFSAALLSAFLISAVAAPVPTPDVFSVRDCGALGDGKTDDTGAVQKALEV